MEETQRVLPPHVSQKRFDEVLQEMQKKGWQLASTQYHMTVMTFQRETQKPPIEKPVGAWSYCSCECHYDGSVQHCMPCCSHCPACDMSIVGDMAAHLKERHPQN